VTVKGGYFIGAPVAGVHHLGVAVRANEPVARWIVSMGRKKPRD
jgi:hypothetical protein